MTRNDPPTRSHSLLAVLVLAFAYVATNQLHSIFAIELAAVRQRMPLQEPIGDP